MSKVYKKSELFEETMHFLGDPCALPVPADVHVARVVGRPLVATGPAAPPDRETFVYILEVVAHVAGIALDFLGLFAARIGKVTVRVGLAVTLEDSREGARLGDVVVAAVVIDAVYVHPGNRQLLHGVAFRQPDVVVGHGVGGGGAHAVLHVLHQGVAEHRAVAEPVNEHAARVDTVVLVQCRERLCEEVVVALALVPQASDGVQRDEDVVAVLVEHLLAVVRGGMVVVGGMVHEVLAGAAVAVQREEHLVRLGVVVVLGQRDEVLARLAADLDLELVAVLDAPDLLQLGSRAAALARGGLVLQGVPELERGGGFLERYRKRGVERAERYRERVKAVGDKADGLALGGGLQEGPLEPGRLPRVAHGNLREVRAARADVPVQVVRAGAMQSLLGDLVAEGVENPDLDGGGGALRIREHAAVHADIAHGVAGSREGRLARSVGLVLVDGELALVIGRRRLALHEEADRGALDGRALFVGNRARYGVGGSHAAKRQKACGREKIGGFDHRLNSFLPSINPWSLIYIAMRTR